MKTFPKKNVKISKLGHVVTGKTPSTKIPEFYGEVYPFITPTDIEEGIRTVRTDRRLSEEGKKSQKNLLLPKNSVCYTCIASIGKICVTTELSFTNQQINSIIVDDQNYDFRFIYYLLRHETERIRSLASGVATPIINKSMFSDIELSIPTFSTQKKIADILSAYDDMIENNARRIKILEEMAQTIYREWFVHFRFPGHEKVKMVDSPLGKIPMGWEFQRLRDIVENLRISTQPGAHLINRRYVPIDCIARKSLALSKYKPWDEAKSSLILFEAGDILFGAMRAYFHKVAIAPFAGVTRTTCFVLRPTAIKLHAFAVMTIFSESTIAYATKHSQGATIPYAVWDGSMSEIKIVLPPQPILDSFQSIIGPMLDYVTASSYRQNNLRQTRDLLLPKLISGKIDVSDLDINTGGIEA